MPVAHRHFLGMFTALFISVFVAGCSSDSKPSDTGTPTAPTVTVPTISSGALSTEPSGVGLATVTTFTFEAQGFASSDGTALSYAWDFGDGTTATGGANVSHQYDRAGFFDVRVLATNSAGQTAVSSVPGVSVTTLTGSWTGHLPVSSGVSTLVFTQEGATVRGHSNHGSNAVVLAGTLTSPRHLELTFTVQPGVNGVTVPFTFPMSLDLDAAGQVLSGTLFGPPFCPCPVRGHVRQ